MSDEVCLPLTPLGYMPGLSSAVVKGSPTMLWDCQVVGINIVRDWFARVRDFFGGNSRAYEKEIKGTVNRMLNDMSQRARHLGADGVIGVLIRVTPFPAKGMSMVVVTMSGTPVKLGKGRHDGDMLQQPACAEVGTPVQS